MQFVSVNMNDVCARPWAYAVEPFHIAPNLCYLGNSWVSIYLIDTGDGLVLIDTAMPQLTYLTLENMRVLGYDPKDIKLILLSHAHYDHCGGAKQIKEYTGAKIYMGKEDLFFLQDRPELITLDSNLPFANFEVDQVYTEEPIVLGNTTIRAIHSPGHTPGTYSFFFNTEIDGKSYRAAMHGGLGVNTLTKEFLHKYNLPLSYQDDFEKNILTLRDMPVDIPLGSHTNHGDMLGKYRRMKAGEQPNPFIDPTGFKEVLNARYADFLKYCRD